MTNPGMSQSNSNDATTTPCAQNPELPDLSGYLTAVCEHYQQWQTFYTLTDAEGKQKLQERVSRQPQLWDSPFEFGLMVQTVPKAEAKLQDGPGEVAEPREKIERFPVLEGLRKYAFDSSIRHVLLVGRPGSGKSTALAKLALEEAMWGDPCGNGSADRIPLLVELRSWQGSIVALIGNTLQRHGLTLTGDQLTVLLQSDRLLLLLDGLNELPSEEARSDVTIFRQNHPKLAMVLTTRELGSDFGVEKRLEMQPLTEPQMQAFVRSYIPEQAEQMFRQLSVSRASGNQTRLRELGQTPLLLWMLCDLFRKTGNIPDNLGLVFRLFTQGYERKLKQDVPIESDREWWKPVLQQLAWVMMQGKKPTELRVAIARSEAVGAIAEFLEGKVPYTEDFARKCLRDLQKHHLIQAGARPEELEFRHQLIQEYYAAEALLERLPGLSDGVLQRQYLNYLKWTEPVALMLALVESEALALRVVRSALDVDLMLGARLAGEVKGEFQRQIVNLIMDRKAIPIFIKLILLGTTQSKWAILILKNVFDTQNSQLCKFIAIDALAKINCSAASEVLNQVLNDEDYWVRVAAEVTLENPHRTFTFTSGRRTFETAKVLENGRIKSINEDNLESLIKLLINENEEDRVREESAKTLGSSNVNNEDAVVALTRLLQDEDRYGRWLATVALHNTSSEIAISALTQALSDGDCDVFCGAACALERTAGSIVLPNLQAVLLKNEEDEEILDNLDVESISTILDAIASIQSKCQYYNHEIYTAAQEARCFADTAKIASNSKIDGRSSGSLYTIYTEGLTIMTDKSPIFNQEHATIGVNYAAEGSKQEFTQHVALAQNSTEAVQRLTNLLEKLRQTNPGKTDEEIFNILIQGFQTMPQRYPQKWQQWKDIFSIIFVGGAEAIKIPFPVVGIPIEILKQLYEIYNRNRQPLPDR